MSAEVGDEKCTPKATMTTNTATLTATIACVTNTRGVDASNARWNSSTRRDLVGLLTEGPLAILHKLADRHVGGLGTVVGRSVIHGRLVHSSFPSQFSRGPFFLGRPNYTQMVAARRDQGRRVPKVGIARQNHRPPRPICRLPSPRWPTRLLRLYLADARFADFGVIEQKNRAEKLHLRGGVNYNERYDPVRCSDASDLVACCARDVSRAPFPIARHGTGAAQNVFLSHGTESVRHGSVFLSHGTEPVRHGIVTAQRNHRHCHRSDVDRRRALPASGRNKSRSR